MVPAAVGDASFSLDGQIVLVTGATRGIGAAIVRRFVASGARVAITHRGSERTVGSVMSHIGDPRALHYVTSKGGLIAFTKSLARSEGGNGIRVNCVVPGAIRTEHEVEQGNDPAESLKNLQSLQSLQYRGAPDDIAAGCQFLASPASDFITGQALTIDGGWSDY
jgi:3-oxoacyl-[acyl-carrier protein] reductase